MKYKKTISSLGITILLLIGYALGIVDVDHITSEKKNAEVVEVLHLPSDRFPETASHVKDAIQNGKTDVCTIDRNGASERRKQSLANTPTKKGYDRDEFPMALCVEGGKGASVRYVTPSDNRGAGSYVGNKVGRLSDGTKFKIVVE